MTVCGLLVWWGKLFWCVDVWLVKVGEVCVCKSCCTCKQLVRFGCISKWEMFCGSCGVPARLGLCVLDCGGFDACAYSACAPGEASVEYGV